MLFKRHLLDIFLLNFKQVAYLSNIDWTYFSLRTRGTLIYMVHSVLYYGVSLDAYSGQSAKFVTDCLKDSGVD